MGLVLRGNITGFFSKHCLRGNFTHIFVRHNQETRQNSETETLKKTENVDTKIDETNLNKAATADTPESFKGFSRAFKKFSELTRGEPLNSTLLNEQEENFTTLLRHSNFIQLGDPEGKIVDGQIIQVVGEDLYIDFGGKFNCVCQKPSKNKQDYVRGARVRLRLNALELSTKFLGAKSEITLREADAMLLGVLRTSTRPRT